MTTTGYSVEAARARFSSLRYSGFAFFDAPGGTQVPDEVGDAIAVALRDASGNLGAPYATGRAVEGILARSKDDGARFLGCTADEIRALGERTYDERGQRPETTDAEGHA